MRKQFLTWLVAVIATAAALLCVAVPASAQGVSNILVVASCGNQTLNPGLGYLGIITEDTSGKLCVNATVTASVSGFAPGGAYANLSATGSSASVALPAGTTVAFQNTGTTTCCVKAKSYQN